ncbi:unnamed protein product [Paramecium sonneborni]|uniref:Uncharacterized protein n=1 Tax=Paramecium sonneborni TaxID=65129 RepID=A0A8S1K3A7_9CILI|nr:unnamed protein product [Paramecium sonneborni]
MESLPQVNQVLQCYDIHFTQLYKIESIQTCNKNNVSNIKLTKNDQVGAPSAIFTAVSIKK